MLAENAAPAAGKPLDPAWAWAPYEPSAERPWNLRWAGHLLRRATWGPSWQQLQQAVAAGPQRTIEKLLEPAGDVAGFNRTYDEYEAGSGSDAIAAMRAWWLRRIMLSPHPLLEKMTLFWHSHFAVSNDKVGDALLMHQHVKLLRSHALGRFGTLLDAVSRDPATLLCFENNANHQSRRSDHFARVLLESFTLGPGQASQQDVRETARALTGWFVLQHRFRLVDHEHDLGVKKILGQQGNFDGAAVVQLLLTQPATPRYLVRKLYHWLIAETDEPRDELLAPLSESFAHDFDVSRLVGTMLRSNLFFSRAAYRQRIKSPIEFALGIIKGLGEVVATAQLGDDLAELGQSLYYPPGGKGWQGGRAWINHSTLLGRSNLAMAMLSGVGAYGEKLDPLALAKRERRADGKVAGQLLLDLFLQGDVEANVVETLLGTPDAPPAASEDARSRWLRGLAHAIVCLPEFQLG